TQHATEAPSRPSPWAPLADAPFVAFCLLTMLVWMMFFQVFVTLPIDMRSHGLSAATYGALIALNGVLIFALQPFVARALSGFARHRVLAFAGLLVGDALDRLHRRRRRHRDRPALARHAASPSGAGGLGGSETATQHAVHGIEIDRLDQVLVESRRERAHAIRLLPESGQRHHQR